MASFIKVVYPQIEVGKSHARPSRPDCCINISEVSVTWDIHSADEADRAEYWEIDVAKHDPSICSGEMTAAEVETAVYGPAGKAQWLIDNPAPADPE